MIDLLQLTAERLHSVPDGWKWFRVDSTNKPEDFIELQGGIPIGEYRSGPRKGRPKWGADSSTIWIRRSEMDQVAKDWEAENEKCYQCEGGGNVVIASSITSGSVYGPCRRCKGTGKRND